MNLTDDQKRRGKAPGISSLGLLSLMILLPSITRGQNHRHHSRRGRASADQRADTPNRAGQHQVARSIVHRATALPGAASGGDAPTKSGLPVAPGFNPGSMICRPVMVSLNSRLPLRPAPFVSQRLRRDRSAGMTGKHGMTAVTPAPPPQNSPLLPPHSPPLAALHAPASQDDGQNSEFRRQNSTADC